VSLSPLSPGQPQGPAAHPSLHLPGEDPTRCGCTSSLQSWGGVPSLTEQPAKPPANGNAPKINHHPRLEHTKQRCLCPPALLGASTPQLTACLSASLCCPKTRCRAGASQHHGGDVMGQRGGMGHGQGRRVSLQGGVGGPMASAFLMRPQPGELGVGTLANLALVGTLAGVQADVVAEGGGLAEAAVAEAAHEGLVQGVDAHVGAQVAAGVEAAVADDAAHAPRRAGARLHGVEILWGQQGMVRSCRTAQQLTPSLSPQA